MQETPDQQIERFSIEASRLATEAARQSLEQRYLSHKDAASIDALIVATCTGYLCPGLSSYVAENLKLDPAVRTIDLVGMGCGGAIPAIRTACDYVQAHPGRNALVICVEICSAALHWAERPDLILSNCLFSDGAAALIVSSKVPNGPDTALSQQTQSRLRIKSFDSLLWPQHREALRFRNLDSRLCNTLSPEVPEISAHAALELFERRPDSHEQLDCVAVHTGGRKILESVSKKLDFTVEQMQASYTVLKNYGNMSSPSVLFVLKEILKHKKLKEIATPGKPQQTQKESLALFSFGAGFTAFALWGEIQYA